jgi:hypothetical protein
MSRDDAKPPRIARDEHDREWMETWLNTELNKILDIADKKLADAVKQIVADLPRTKRPDDVISFRHEPALGAHPRKLMWIAKSPAWQRSEDWAIEAAKRGDIGPLRARYPELAQADMLKLPAQPGRGRRFTKDNSLTSFEHDLTEAVWDADQMRTIWKQEYESRPKGYNPPEQMAARRNGVQEEHVRAWQKNRRCPKRPS